MSSFTDARNQESQGLIYLPTELHLIIVANLSVLERQMLRMTNRHFHEVIPRSTPGGDEILEAIDNPFIRDTGLVYCNPCERLQRPEKFDAKMLHREPGAKFCIICGIRPLENPWERDIPNLDRFRYQKGDRWQQDGMEYKRGNCIGCEECTPMEIEPHPVEKNEEYGWRPCRDCLLWYIEKGSIHDIEFRGGFLN